jgi:hypothetical protein
MKNSILILVIVGLTNCLFGQPYSSYINNTSSWGMLSSGNDGINNVISHFKYDVNGDTTIGSYDYFQLYRVGVDSVFPDAGGIPTATLVNTYAGALREDFLKKFYFIYQGQTTEYLLFDFNLNIGSYLSNTQGDYGCNNPPLMVQSDDTVYLGSAPRKRFKVNNNFVNRIIEGVGSEGGLIEQGSMCLYIESSSQLICYSKDNNVLLIDSNLPCGLATGIEEVSLNHFSIFPNPFNNNVSVTLQKENSNIARLTVLNLVGQQVYYEDASNLNSTYNKTIDLSFLANGVYLLEVVADGEKVVKKIVKQ